METMNTYQTAESREKLRDSKFQKHGDITPIIEELNSISNKNEK